MEENAVSIKKSIILSIRYQCLKGQDATTKLRSEYLEGKRSGKNSTYEHCIEVRLLQCIM